MCVVSLSACVCVCVSLSVWLRVVVGLNVPCPTDPQVIGIAVTSRPGDRVLHRPRGVHSRAEHRVRLPRVDVPPDAMLSTPCANRVLRRRACVDRLPRNPAHGRELVKAKRRVCVVVCPVWPRVYVQQLMGSTLALAAAGSAPPASRS